MTILISVITCTHNPRLDYLNRILMALNQQTFPLENWELLLIDNASSQDLSSAINLDWHPNARVIREENLGLTFARLRGIQESKAELLVFVDDDNVLDSDYLQVALNISKDYPFIGAWGGQISGDFEIEPPAWTKPYWKYLAIRQFEQDQWSNLFYQNPTIPCGAGLCVRKTVAEEYVNLVQNDKHRLSLDRQGTFNLSKILFSCGDTDLAFTACDIGLGTGQFTALTLVHLIPAHRLEEKYLIKLAEGIAYSNIILDYFRGKVFEFPVKTFVQKIADNLRCFQMSPRQRRFYQAEQRAILLARKQVLNFQSVDKK